MTENIKTERYRDLSITHIPGGYIITACDSTGSIGEKEHDFLYCPAEFVGRCAVRVPLMEILSFGAAPICITNAVSGEMEPTGRKIIDGIRQELKFAGVDISVLNGSTEENMPTAMTAAGVSVVGYMSVLPPVKNILPSDVVIIMGKMKVGEEVFDNYETEPVTYDDIKYLCSDENVKEIIPLGSKGVMHEVDILSEYNGLGFSVSSGCSTDLFRSAGPATAVIAVVEKDGVGKLLENSKISVIGEFI